MVAGHGERKTVGGLERIYADGGGAAIAVGTFTAGTDGKATLGTTTAGIGGRVSLGTDGTAGIGGSATCGTVTLGTAGMGGSTACGTAGSGCTVGKVGTAGRPGTAAAAGAAATAVVSAKWRATWQVLLARRSAHATTVARKLAAEAILLVVAATVSRDGL